MLRVDTGSSQESTDIATELGGSYAAFSAEAKVKFQEAQSKYRNEIFVRMYHEGGPVDLKISDPGNPVELLDNANRFLDSFEQRPTEVSQPYFVTLADRDRPWSTPTERRRHRTFAGRYRVPRKTSERLLDQLNLVDYIAYNPTRYDYSNGADPTALAKSRQDFQTDLDLVASCASDAINHPTKAEMPADFAIERGMTFPLGTLPDPLPVAEARPATVTVPDFRTCATWSECLKLAERSNLKVTPEYHGDKPEKFRVIDFRPPKDTV